MKSIDHLPVEEQQHFTKCDCGEYFDMRNLSDVFKHLHGPSIPEPHWTYSVKLGEPAAYCRSDKTVGLN